MHGPDLHLKKISRLPLHIRVSTSHRCCRRLVLTAIRDSQDVERFLAEMRLVPQSLPKSKTPHLMPALSSLDPAYLPSMNELDDPLARTEAKIRHLYDSTTPLSLPLSSPSGPELWPRLWASVKFIHMYREQLPGATVDEAAFCTDFLMFTVYPHNKPGAASFMLTEPGVYFMIGRAFKYLFDIRAADQKPWLRQLSAPRLRTLSALLADIPTADSAPVEEILPRWRRRPRKSISACPPYIYVLDTRETPLSSWEAISVYHPQLHRGCGQA
ncbi:hypothetical protein DFH09DRAFT_1282822 [Mycena vulgaris]|nr:hypothetical protein DFH09DRAFT_1282822 [Mycena vulgaris]